MKEFDRLLLNVGRPAWAARIVACAGAAAALSGCVHPIAETKVDPTSPVAPYVAEAARQNTGYPKFSDIPPMPKDVRPPAGYRARVQALETERADLEQQTAANTWTLGNTMSFATRAQREVGPGIAPSSSTPATEAFAASQRQRATQPPPPAN